MANIFSDEHPLYPLVITLNVIFTSFLAVCASVATMISNNAIQGELALSSTESVWLTTLYFLGINIVIPSANWMAERFGFKRVYAYGVVIFTFGALLTAIAGDFWTLAAGRLVQGMGGGWIFPLGLALIVQSLPSTKVNLGVSIYVAAVFGGGLGIGILLSGYLTQFANWRDLFFIIMPISALAAGVCWISRPKIPQITKTPFDFWGLITANLFVSSLLVALTMAPIPAADEGWRTSYVVICLMVSAISLIACGMIEWRHPNPIFPIRLFSDPIFSLSIGAMLLLGMATFASVGISIDYMINNLHYEKWVTGKIACVYGLTVAVIGTISNYLTKLVPTSLLTFAGLIILVFSYFLNNELDWMTGYRQVIQILVIRGIGIGLAFGPTTLLALQGVANKDKSPAVMLLTFSRILGGTYGGALFAIISIRQTIFHAARWGEQASAQLPAYRNTFTNLVDQFSNRAVAKAMIVKNIENQAVIQGYNDAFIAYGYITGTLTLCLIAVVCFRAWKRCSG